MRDQQNNILTENLAELQQGSWIIILHAQRIPPHIGIIFSGRYHSLSIKGAELNVSVEALLKSIQVRKIPSLAFQLVKHPVFSTDHLNDCFVHQLLQSPLIEAGKTSCFSPVKEFLQEFYTLDEKEVEFVYHLIPFLQKNEQISKSLSFHLPEPVQSFTMPQYSKKELEEGIEQAYLDVQQLQNEIR